MKREVYFK